MAKHKKEAADAVVLKDVAFSFDEELMRTSTVETEEYKPFKITYRTPSGNARMSVGLSTQAPTHEERGKAMMDFMAEHLVGWTLPQKITPETAAHVLGGIRDNVILFGIFNTMIEAADAGKNSPTG